MAETLSTAAQRLARDLAEEGYQGDELADEIERELRSDRPDTTTRSRQEAAARAAGTSSPTEGERAFRGHQERRGRQRAALGRRFREAGNVTGAKRTILGVALVVLSVGIVRDVRAGRAFTSDVVARRLFGTFTAAILLIILSGPAPGVAKGLALIMGAASILVDGKAFTEAVRLGAKKPASGSGTDPVSEKIGRKAAQDETRSDNVVAIRRGVI